MVYRYLQESGFVHSAFTFSFESCVLNSSLASHASHVPPGALTSLIQKGMLYLQVEHQVDSDVSVRHSSCSSSDARDGADSFHNRECGIALSARSPELWLTMARSQSVRYAKWIAKHDKNKEDNEDDHITDEPEAKRKRASGAVIASPPDSALTMGVSNPPCLERLGSALTVPVNHVPEQPTCQQATQIDSHGTPLENPSRECDKHEASRSIAEVCASRAIIASNDTTRSPAAGSCFGGDRVSLGSGADYLGLAIKSSDTSLCESTSIRTTDALHQLQLQDHRASDSVTVLSGHKAEVFCCAWHPTEEVLASGSGDSTVRLWDLRRSSVTDEHDCRILCNPRLVDDEFGSIEDRDVTTLEWSTDGTLLATGCMDGVARLWTRDGVLKHSLEAHTESIFSLRFDDTGQRIVTGSYDKSVSVWDVATGSLHSKFEAHSAQVLDVDWKHGPRLPEAPTDIPIYGENTPVDIFASCSTDKTIAIYTVPLQRCNVHDKCDAQQSTGRDGVMRYNDSQVGWGLSSRDPDLIESAEESVSRRAVKEQVETDEGVSIVGLTQPIQILNGHVDEVNAIRWSPSGTLLASCSDDKTVLLWRLGLSTPVRHFREHTEEIYTIRWSPAGPGTCNPSAPVLLASASFDASIKLWDAEAGACACTLKKHDKKVYSIAFSPSGEFIASGSLGGQVNVWSVRSGGLITSHVARYSTSQESPARTPDSGVAFKSMNTRVPMSTASSDIFEVAWDSSGTKIAATSTNAVMVIDLRKVRSSPSS